MQHQKGSREIECRKSKQKEQPLKPTKISNEGVEDFISGK